MTISISVVIPVYNAADYVRQAVESALAQPETGEVLLVEDGSQDNSLAVCEQLAHEYDGVRLLRHPNGENRGAGASRNLGIVNACSDVIAFLDADDYYLPGRFTVAARILTQHIDIDGVYETLQLQFTNDEAAEYWRQRLPEFYDRGLFGPARAFPPDDLLDAIVRDDVKFFSGNGLTVRKAALKRVGLYTSQYSEDFVMCIKLAAAARLEAGRLDEPVAVYRVHGSNRSLVTQQTDQQIVERFVKVWDVLWTWSLSHLSPAYERRFFEKLTFWLHKRKSADKAARARWFAQKARRNPMILTRRYVLKAWVVSLPGIGGFLLALRRRIDSPNAIWRRTD